MYSFRNKVVIVTGASSGIGAETAVQFASKGAKVTITGRNEERLNDTFQKCLSAGATDQDIIIVRGDITKSDVMKRIIDETILKFGQIDVLVNNAGWARLNSLKDVDEDDLLWVYKLNVVSAVILTQRAMPHLLKTKGNVVNVSSLNACRPIPSLLSYTMPKTALEMFSKCVALEYAGKGVRVNTVSPGHIDTPMLVTVGLCENNPEAIQELLKSVSTNYPMQRTGLVYEVAAAILYMASDKASFITGASMPVDGGRHCWMQGVEQSN